MLRRVVEIDGRCPNCSYGTLMLINNSFPFETHLMCDCCDSTFVIEKQL